MFLSWYPLRTTKSAAARLTAETRLEIGPFDLALGRVAPAIVRGWVSRSGYGFAIQGDAQLQRLLQVARTVGIPTQQPNAEGQANVDLQIAGSWSGFAAPRAVGKAQLHSIHATVRGLNAPLEIASGEPRFGARADQRAKADGFDRGYFLARIVDSSETVHRDRILSYTLRSTR